LNSEVYLAAVRVYRAKKVNRKSDSSNVLTIDNKNKIGNQITGCSGCMGVVLGTLFSYPDPNGIWTKFSHKKGKNEEIFPQKRAGYPL
jgi:hypothetical protein